MKQTYRLLLLLISISASAQLTKIQPLSPFNGGYGKSVAISGNEIVSGSSASYWNNMQPKAYVHTFGNGIFTPTDVLTPNDGVALDNFGASVAIGPNMIAVGAPLHDGAATDAGAVYIYVHTPNGNYVQYEKIQAPDAAAGDQFGGNVEIYGTHLYVSAVYDEADNEPVDTNRGAVYHYNFVAGELSFIGKITQNISGVHRFGEQIETDGDKVVISSRVSNDDWDARMNFHVFEVNGLSLVFDSELLDLGSITSQIEGFDYKFEKIHTVQYADNNGFSQGKVEIFENQDGNWQSEDVFYVTNDIPIPWSDHVYTQIEVIDNRIFLGSTGYFLATSRKFPVLNFEKTGDEWTFQDVFYGNQINTMDDDYFGSCIASDGPNLLIGAFMDRPGEAPFPPGAVYFLDTNTLKTSGFASKIPVFYPNPTQDVVYFKDAQLQDVRVYAANGTLVLQSKEANQISLANLSNGIYLVKTQTNDGQFQTFKIIKN